MAQAIGVCKYCGKKNIIYIWDPKNFNNEKCYKCDSPLTLEDLKPKSHYDIFGYDYIEPSTKQVDNTDPFGYNYKTPEEKNKEVQSIKEEKYENKSDEHKTSEESND